LYNELEKELEDDLEEDKPLTQQEEIVLYSEENEEVKTILRD
jgi:hypothetical protein